MKLYLQYYGVPQTEIYSLVHASQMWDGANIMALSIVMCHDLPMETLTQICRDIAEEMKYISVQNNLSIKIRAL